MSLNRPAPRGLSEALRALAGEVAPATPLARVQSVWAQALGPAISDAASPTAMRDGVLSVVCKTAGWAQELDLMSPDLTARLNDALAGEVIREVRWRAG